MFMQGIGVLWGDDVLILTRGFKINHYEHRLKKVINNLGIPRKQKLKILTIVRGEVRKEMFKLFKHSKPKLRNPRLYSPQFEYAIIFKPGAVESIKKVKGWRSDAEMARNLYVTRQYICNLKKQRAACTSTIITRIAACLGNIEDHWYEFYQLKPLGFIRTNDMQYNQQKYLGQIPYEKYSISAEFRKQDYAVEQNK